MLEISYLGRREIVLSVYAKTKADQRLCFRIGKNPFFSRRGSFIHARVCGTCIYELRHEKTNISQMRKQGSRSASQLLRN